MPEEIDFGFLFCRVMRFYGMSYRETLGLPISFFWLSNVNIDRIQAQEDLRGTSLATLSNASEEVYSAYTQKLVLELGTVVKMPSMSSLTEPLDEAGLNELRSMQ